MDDPVTEDEIQAYVDGQLDARRHAMVERWLAARPDIAAQVMADKALAGLLRTGLTAASTPPQPRRLETERQARRLGRRLLVRRVTRGLGQAAVASLLLSAGWGLHAGLAAVYSPADAAPRIPLFVDEAADAYRTAMRENITEHKLTYQDLTAPSQLASLDPASSVTIPLPSHGWTLLGAQIVPWDKGDAAQIFWQGNDKTLVLFASQTNDSIFPALNDEELQVATLDQHSYVYWRAGEQVYVLSGNLTEDVLLLIANSLQQQTG